VGIDKRLGLLVARKRVELGLSQTSLAKSVGISRPYLTQIETGKRLPAEETAQALVTALGISAEELANEVRDLVPEDQMSALLPFIRVFDKLQQFLTPEQFEEIAAMLGSMEQTTAALRTVAGEPTPPGPDRWLDLTKEDRRFVQRMVNRLADGPKAKESRNDDHASD